MTLLYILFGVFFVTFMLIVFRGAPYVPTKRRDVLSIFDEHSFSEDDVLVDLGSGDGRLLIEAAKRGVSSVGYELNPFLALISQWRLRSYGQRARVVVRDFWLSKLPSSTSVVFVFLATVYMTKLDQKLARHVSRHKKPLTLISYGMEMPGKKPVKTVGSLLFYRYKP